MAVPQIAEEDRGAHWWVSRQLEEDAIPRRSPQASGGGHWLRSAVVTRIGLVSTARYSHAQAITRLAEVLVRQGHEVTVWAPERWREQVRAHGARFEPHEPEVVRGKRGFPLAAELASITERFAEELIAQVHGHEIELLVRDNQAIWALVAGEYLGIPRLVAHPAFPLVAPGSRVPRDEDDSSAAEEERAREEFAASWLSIAGRWGVELDDLTGVFHDTPEPTITFTTEEIIGHRELRPVWHCVGPLMSPPPPREEPRTRRLVYACFGTLYNTRPELFRFVIEALGRQPFDVLISTGDGHVSAEQLRPLPGNVEVREFVPAREVLARAAIHVTHGGCGSVHESLLAGVPMVCIPQAYDQVPLSERVEALGAGAVAEEEPAAIRAAVLSLLGDARTRRRVAELGDHLVGYDGEGRVAAIVERVVAGAEA